MEAAVQKLMKSHKAAIYFEQFREAMEDELKRREKFLDEIDEDIKAEFINGVIFMHLPAKEEHSAVVIRLGALLQFYVNREKLGRARVEQQMIVLTRNAYLPDVNFFGKIKSNKIGRKQMRYPVPDFIAEVLSPSTKGNDRGVKFNDYAAHGVSEYWIIDPDKEFLEQYILKGEIYELRLKAETGRVCAQAIQGFDIPVRALFDDDESETALKALMGWKSKD
jgi:Uma2 family endonuclease